MEGEADADRIAGMVVFNQALPVAVEILDVQVPVAPEAVARGQLDGTAPESALELVLGDGGEFPRVALVSHRRTEVAQVTGEVRIVALVGRVAPHEPGPQVDLPAVSAGVPALEEHVRRCTVPTALRVPATAEVFLPRIAVGVDNKGKVRKVS